MKEKYPEEKRCLICENKLFFQLGRALPDEEKTEITVHECSFCRLLQIERKKNGQTNCIMVRVGKFDVNNILNDDFDFDSLTWDEPVRRKLNLPNR